MNIYIQLNPTTTRGPFTLNQVRAMLASGEIMPSHLAYVEGQTAWIPVTSLPGMRAAPMANSLGLEPRKSVGGWLVVGILFLPYVFSWFTLRRGYSTAARVLSFVWLGVVLIGFFSKSINDRANLSNSTRTAETTSKRTRGNIADDLNQFRSKLQSIDPKGSIILSISPGRMEDEVEITVANYFHYQPYQVRYQAAQGMWSAWAAIRSPDEPDSSRIQIVDQMGNEVGGSRAFAGSLIWVQDEK